MSAAAKGVSIPFAWRRDFVGVTELQKPDVSVDAEAVFVGHGIFAPEFQWDDFKGVDVKGKVLVLFTNEPRQTIPGSSTAARSPTTAGGRTSSSQAGRMGAAGAVIIHTNATAGYGWEVVKTPGPARNRK